VDDIVAVERITFNEPLALVFGPQFEHYARLLYDELHRGTRQDGMMIECIMRMWLRELATVLRETERGEVPRSLVSACQHIESHYQEPVSLADLCAASNLSTSWLGTLLRRCFAMSPIEYLIKFRITRARLLAHQKFTICYVADRTGFDDPLYFSRQFKRR
jgi:AraC-like DNA-binding protein